MGSRKPLILFSLLLAAFAINLDTTIVNVALPTLVRELHASNSQLQWVVDAYNLVFVALLLASGSLSDRVGRKGMLLSGLGVFGLSRAPRIDRPGFALSTVAMALLVYTIIEAPVHGWSGARTLAGFAAAAALLGVFVAWERRARAPMLDVALFRNPRFAAASGAVTVAFFTLFGFIFLITQYFQFFKGYSPLSAGVHLLPVASAVGVASVLGTRLAVRFGTKLVVVTGLLAVAGFYAWVSTASVSTAYATIAAQMVLYGVGMGLTSAPATEAIMGVVPVHKAGVGSAVNDTTRLLGGTLGVAVIGSVYASLYASRLTSALPAGLPAAVTRTAHGSVGAALAVADK